MLKTVKELVKTIKAPIIRDLIEELDSGNLPEPIFSKILSEIHISLFNDNFISLYNLKNKEPGILYLRIFGRDYVVYQRADNKLEMIEKNFYEILKCKQII